MNVITKQYPPIQKMQLLEDVYSKEGFASPEESTHFSFHGCGDSLLALVTTRTRVEISPQPWQLCGILLFAEPSSNIAFHSIYVLLHPDCLFY